MIVLDSSIVNVSIPTIIDDIGINLTDAQWVTSLYNIVLAALLLPFGKLGDARGRKLVFQVGTVIFVASSTLAAASQGAGMLLAARVLQGIGGAMIMPNTLSTVSALFRGKYRAAAFGVWGCGDEFGRRPRPAARWRVHRDSGMALDFLGELAVGYRGSLCRPSSWCRKPVGTPRSPAPRMPHGMPDPIVSVWIFRAWCCLP